MESGRSNSPTQLPTHGAPSRELQRRVITGLVGGVALVLLVIYGGWIGIGLLCILLSLGMTSEFAAMVFQLPDRAQKQRWMIGLCVLLNLVALVVDRRGVDILERHGVVDGFLFAFLALFILFLVSAKRYASDSAHYAQHFRELMFSVFGLIYATILTLYLSRLHSLAWGVEWTLLFLLIVWAGDTGAYFAGRKWGKTKLYPEVSPKKTWEGSWGGLAAGLIVSLLVKLSFFPQLSWLGAALIPLIVGVIAQVGDLCESFLKRSFDQKDSGSILAGHGGFLDRFDGVIFSLPVMFVLARLFS